MHALSVDNATLSHGFRIFHLDEFCESAKPDYIILL
jgi:hypothetical protein